MKKLGDIARTARDLILELAGVDVIQIKMTPVVAFREPDEFVRRRKITPVHTTVPRLEEVRCMFVKNLAHIAGLSVRHAQPFIPVIA